MELSSADIQKLAFTGEDGKSYTFKITSVDDKKNENISDCSASISIQSSASDTISPKITYTSISPVSPGTSLTPSISLTLSEVTATGGLRLYSDSLCATSVSAAVTGTAGLNTIVTTSLTANAATTIYAKAVDPAGNASTCTNLITYNNDSTAPTISSISAQSTSLNTATIAIAFTIGDANSTMSCSDTYLRMESSDNALVLAGSVVWAGTYPNCTAVVTPVTSGLGTVALTFIVTDSAGGTASTTFNLIISTTFALGQTSTTSNANLEKGLTSPTAAIIAGGKLFVADGSNRVLVWNTIPTTSTEPPSFALGQPDLTSYAINNGPSPGTVSSVGMYNPSALYSDGVRLFVADAQNHRVLVWNSLPTSSGQAASFALGQPDLVSGTANNGGVSAASLDRPTGVYVVGTKLFVSDQNNNRVLVWNTLPTSSGQSANFVLGQANLTSSAGNSGGVSGSSLSGPAGIYSDGTKLFVADSGNARILVWNAIPTTTAQAASFALGQSNLTSSGATTSPATAAGMYGPSSVTSDGTKLFVTDQYNNRVLVWNTMPTVSGQAANFALGQTDLVSSTTNNNGPATGSVLGGPTGVFSDGSKLYVAETYNSRVLVWNSVPTTSGQSASFAIGQANLTEVASGNPGITAASMSGPSGIHVTGTKLFVADAQFNRILVWNTLPSSSGQPADLAIGQANLTSRQFFGGGSTSSTSLYNPTSSYSNGVKLYVSDMVNSRILVWNSIPTSSGQAADFVLGQSSFTTNSGNSGGISGSSLYWPIGVSGDGTRLFVADWWNNRVLVWNTLPTSTAQVASFALGQANFTSASANAGGVSGSKLSRPTSVYSNGTKLFVADSINNRVLVWNTMPTASGQTASFALGQPNLTSNTANNGGLFATSLSGPGFVYSDGTKLFVSDCGNNRVLVWNTLPTSSGQAADAVIGQSNFTSSTAGLSPTKIGSPSGLAVAGGKLYIVDSYNNRVLGMPAP